MQVTVCIVRFFGGDTSQVPTQALTVGVGTVMDAREVSCEVMYMYTFNP